MVYWVVGAAGIFGAISRFLLGDAAHRLWSGAFPYGTLLINLLGSLLLGALLQYGAIRTLSAAVKEAIGTGFIGSFTTFSAFSAESMELLRQHRYAVAVCYILLSLWGGWLMAWVGERIANKLASSRIHTAAGGDPK